MSIGQYGPTTKILLCTSTMFGFEHPTHFDNIYPEFQLRCNTPGLTVAVTARTPCNQRNTLFNPKRSLNCNPFFTISASQYYWTNNQTNHTGTPL
ncbi:hypothetical protein JHK87_008959 [Glycine soja]|nr:hypothetical protein JHK87_008959 [Glycine soja]